MNALGAHCGGMFLEVKFVLECEIIFFQYVFKELVYDFTG